MKIHTFITALALVCGTLLASAAPISAQSELSQPVSAGEFDNGMRYVVRHSDGTENGIFVEIVAHIPPSEKSKIMFYLLEHAMFNGTVDRDQSEVASALSELGFSINVDSNVIYNDLQQAVRFSLFDKKPDAFPRLLTLLKQVTFFPALSDGGIELARLHLLNGMQLTDEETAMLKGITAAEVREAYAHWIQPSNLLISITGATEQQQPLPLLMDTFGGISNTSQEVVDFSYMIKERGAATVPMVPAESEMSPEMLANHLIEMSKLGDKIDRTITRSEDGQTYIIDGKIFMKAPVGLQSQENTMNLGAAAVACVGVIAATVLACVAGPVAIPFAIPVAVGTFFAGAVLSKNIKYVNDPQYIASYRMAAMEKGFAYTYRQGVAQYVLTPAERRAMFIQEMQAPPAGKTSVDLLMNTYELSDPVMAGFLTKSEVKALSELKEEYL